MGADRWPPALFCIGLFGALSRRNIVGILMGVELMLNAVNINLIGVLALSRARQHQRPDLRDLRHHGGGSEAAVGLAMVIAVYRTRLTVNADEVDSVEGIEWTYLAWPG